MSGAATIRVELDRIVPVRIEVELPTRCPHCGLSFEEEDALIEEGYCATNQPCSIGEDGEGGVFVDGYAATESVYDLGLVVGYQCGGCRTPLVSTEGAKGEGGIPDGTAG